MSEKPILFSGPMVRAILDGRKTQTRRVVKPQPHGIRGDALGQPFYYPVDASGYADPRPLRAPYQPGDLLWVREAHWINETEGLVAYRADGEMPREIRRECRWRPSIHMPRWAARIFLRVTDVRVERVQDITEADAVREGFAATETVDHSTAGRRFGRYTFGPMTEWHSAAGNFEITWDSLNAKRGHGWDTNPWVWVYTFEREAA